MRTPTENIPYTNASHACLFACFLDAFLNTKCIIENVAIPFNGCSAMK